MGGARKRPPVSPAGRRRVRRAASDAPTDTDEVALLERAIDGVEGDEAVHGEDATLRPPQAAEEVEEEGEEEVGSAVVEEEEPLPVDASLQIEANLGVLEEEEEEEEDEEEEEEPQGGLHDSP